MPDTSAGMMAQLAEAYRDVVTNFVGVFDPEHSSGWHSSPEDCLADSLEFLETTAGHWRNVVLEEHPNGAG